MDNIPPPIPPAYPPQPVGGRNWWQRNWKWFVPAGCVSLLLLLTLFVGGIMVFVFGMMKSSDPYKTAIERAKANTEVTEALGTPVSEGMFVSGNISVTGGSGNVDFSIPISGPKGKATIYVVGTKSEDQWNYSKMNARIEGTGTDIDLLR
jgi:hypothetical protein